ncbi:MAG: OmpA family protein [Chitinophagaceae bacterium]
MTKILLLIFAFVQYLTAGAQHQADGQNATHDSATVNVLVTDMKGNPSAGERVLFTGEKTGQSFSGHSSAGGRFSLRLPAGEKYSITVRNPGDSIAYGSIEIPALKPGQFFTGAFTVEINFEPARSFTLKDVHFDTGKSSLRPESFRALEDLVDYLRYKEDVKIEVAGHTDNVGADNDNKVLSLQRAETIRSYLVKKGIKPQRIIARGYGASLPVADNQTEQGRQLNRRTEVKIL